MRRVAYLEVSESLSIVSTVGCMHTILRDDGQTLKMGSPDAYDQSTVLTIDETTGTIELNEHLLRQQFVIPVSGAAR